MIKILFLCTGNSCRSQMAEGWARSLKSGVVEPYSAGVQPHGLHPLAVKVMAEAGVDISKQVSKSVETVAHLPFDYVITVCDHAREICAFFPGPAKKLHVTFDDPPYMARNAKTEEEALVYFRRVRDEIRDFIMKLPGILELEGKA